MSLLKTGRSAHWLVVLVLALATVEAHAYEDASSRRDSDSGEPGEEEGEEKSVDFELEIEAKIHFRDSDSNRFPVNFPFAPDQLPLGQSNAFLETVNEGQHLEVSTVILRLDAHFGDRVQAHAKVDLVDLYDRNPTSTDGEIDIDEIWIRLGEETEPATLAERTSAYFKVGKMPKFERQDDRHLESYGLVSTAFNRFEDMGIELGVDLGRHFYLKATATQGNPVFMRDPNALAGDNGVPSLVASPLPNPDPSLKSGIVIPYDAEVEDLDVDGDLEVGLGLGVRIAGPYGINGADLLTWVYKRNLAETIELEGTLYGGDLDLLRGPFNAFSFPVTSDEKKEVGANLWLYLGDFTLFGQFVDQDLGGLKRTGFEVEVSHRFDLPVGASIGGLQLFPFIAPSVRFSALRPDFASPAISPSPSFSWDWDKLDLGIRLGVVDGVDLTLEYANNDFILGSGAEVGNDEFLVTLRFRH